MDIFLIRITSRVDLPILPSVAIKHADSRDSCVVQVCFSIVRLCVGTIWYIHPSLPIFPTHVAISTNSWYHMQNAAHV